MGFASEARTWLEANLTLSTAYIPSKDMTALDKIMLDSTMTNFLNADVDFMRYFIISDKWIKRDDVKVLRELYWNSVTKLKDLLETIRSNGGEKHLFENVIDFYIVEMCLYMLEEQQCLLSREVLSHINEIYLKYF